MFSKLFALIETYQVLKELLELAFYEYQKYVVSKYGKEIDKKQAQRNAYLDAIKVAKEEKNADKIRHYSLLLTTHSVSKPRDKSSNS